ncbi:UNVERIFIED_CONTAM: hypothetical protein GTU68_063095, partial [Idotea baltica]|nr:hypothetical protein [Idotea baltica]
RHQLPSPFPQNKTVDVRRVGPTSFQCGVCGKLFCRLTKVLEHHVSHTGEKPWECDGCDRKFAKYYSMQKHKRVKHTPAHLQKFTCYICDKNFSVQSVLQMHLDTHATLKPFPCAVCGQTFALKFTKDAHEAQHTGGGCRWEWV